MKFSHDGRDKSLAPMDIDYNEYTDFDNNNYHGFNSPLDENITEMDIDEVDKICSKINDVENEKKKKSEQEKAKKKNLKKGFNLEHLPILIHNWVHLIYNTLALVFFLTFCFWTAFVLYRDYTLKYEFYQTEILSENQLCSKQYTDNKCHPDTRVPAMDGFCVEWEKCMFRDPSAVASTKITAAVLSEILESFFSNLSYKSALLISLFAFFGILLKSTGNRVGGESTLLKKSVETSKCFILPRSSRKKKNFYSNRRPLKFHKEESSEYSSEDETDYCRYKVVRH